MIKELKNTSKLSVKQKIVQRFATAKRTSYVTEYYLKYVLDPYITYGIQDTNDIRRLLREANGVNPNMSTRVSNLTEDDFHRWFSILEKLYRREFTGKMAKGLVLDFLLPFTEEVQDMFLCCLEKNLHCSLGTKTVNKAFGKQVVPEFNIQLAASIEDIGGVSALNHQSIYYIEPKIDGLRLLAVKDDIGNIILYSRNGRVMSFPYLEYELKQVLPTGLVLDGELQHPLGFKSLMEQAHRIDKDESKLTYHVFDIIPHNALQNCTQYNVSLEYRKTLLNDVLHGYRGSIHILPFKIYSGMQMEDLMYAHRSYLDSSYEGSVIKDAASPYTFGRTKDWLKWKPEHTLDCIIVDVVEGKGKYKGVMGALMVKQENNGQLCSVGSGFSDQERIDFFANKQHLVDSGMYVEVTYQELTEKGIMRFPRFKCLRPDKILN